MTNHVPTIATCQKLKAAGFPQGTAFYWWEPTGIIEQRYSSDIYIAESPSVPGDTIDCAAPILTEILEQLPPRLNGYALQIEKVADDLYIPGYINDLGVGYDHLVLSNANPAEAAALLYLSLKEVREAS